ncbi:hypothetical protein Dda_1628 [Drechslerella dactyloides]|uniref:Uncharacterized protein n=1 Tax=Drechslerella dactyloides TaxID=74499 RepID=A0AAD6J221_DREDA|nr:hypothetical protein Dda_1628 [Drechslerella dactyloides]
MCYTAYRFVVCNRCLEQERDHTFYIHRHPNKNADDEKCECLKLHEVLDRHLPCPMCLQTILLRMSLEEEIQEEAGSDVEVELDYKKYPVFSADDQPSPAGGSKRRIIPVPNRKRDRRNTYLGDIENQPEPYHNAGTIGPDELIHVYDGHRFSGETLVGSALKKMD